MEGTAVDAFISDGHTALIHEMIIHENSLRQALKEVKRAAERIIAEITFSSAIIIYCQRTDR
jgi:lambda repressor-like predicted transcriptional regulator